MRSVNTLAQRSSILSGSWVPVHCSVSSRRRLTTASPTPPASPTAGMNNEISRLYNDDSLSLRTLARREYAMSVTNFITPACEMQKLYQSAMQRLSGRERQLVLKVAPPLKFKPRARGIKIHKAQQEKIMGPVPAPVSNATPIQRYGKSLYELAQSLTLLSRGVSVKEVPVFGSIDGVSLSGVVDTVKASEENGRLALRILELKTTSRVSNVKGSYKHAMARNQLLVYYELFQQMTKSPKSLRERITREQFASSANLSLEMDFTPFEISSKVIPDFLASHPCKTLSDIYSINEAALTELHKARFTVSLDMGLQFLEPKNDDRQLFSEEFDTSDLSRMVKERGLLFDQMREPLPNVPGFEEIRICNHCQFNPICALKKRENQPMGVKTIQGHASVAAAV